MMTTTEQFTKLWSESLNLVWIKCDYPVVCYGLRSILEAECSIHTGSEAPEDSSLSALILCLGKESDLDSELRGLRAQAPGVPILVLLGLQSDGEFARSAIRAGVTGFIHVDQQPEQIIRVLDSAARGEVVIPKGFLKGLVEETGSHPNLSSLTQRQLEILELVAEGHTNREIARRLFISELTVTQHLHNVYKTLGVDNRTQAAKIFLRTVHPLAADSEITRYVNAFAGAR
jgi:DNA-binding NarL/FixJ family response regulator